MGFTPKRAICQTLVVVTALFMTESAPHFSAILALAGGSTITLRTYFCPSIFYLKLASKQPPYNDCWLPISVSLNKTVLNIEIMILGLVAGLAATYSAVTDLADSKFSVPCYVNPKIPDT